MNNQFLFFYIKIEILSFLMIQKKNIELYKTNFEIKKWKLSNIIIFQKYK